MSIASLNPKLHGKRRLPALTSLRIIAAIHVVLFHYGLGLVHQSTDQYIAATRHSAAPLHWTAYILGHGITNIIAAGSWSVSLFFILSGFILFYNYGDDRENSLDAKKFWIARFARIYPVYLVGILVMAPFLFHRWAVDPRFTTHKIVTGGVLSLAMLQSWFPRHYATLFNGPGWSMSVEAFCYALFPLLLLPPAPGRPFVRFDRGHRRLLDHRDG